MRRKHQMLTDRGGGQVVRASASVAGGNGFDPWPGQAKSLKLVVVALPFVLRIMGIALRLSHSCRDNGLVKIV